MTGRPARLASAASASETISARRSASSTNSRECWLFRRRPVFDGQDAAQVEQDLARDLAVAARRAQAIERLHERLRDQLSDVAYAVAVGIERVAQPRQHQHREQQRVRRRHGAQRGRSIERGQVAPEARAPQRRLFAVGLALEAVHHLGRQDLEQLGLQQQLHRSLGRARAQQAIELLGHARLRALRDLQAVLHHPPVGLGLDGQIAARGELHRAQDADRVLAEADVGIADGADDARLQIGDAGRRGR